ncbi:hypothetical protein ACFVH7_17935 [Kitasatospora indigofera]|uniref:hypothetical protein n=1 Tax=Kitasatospora indigofera TaxID=67307 RepID=UPI003636B590
MSFTGLWVVMPVPAVLAGELAPVLGPTIEAQAASSPGPKAATRWWQGGAGTVDSGDLHDLAAPFLLDDHLDELYEVWGDYEHAGPFLKSACRKGYPASGLAWALGPRRFGALPGWFGNFVLSPDEVCSALPAVEAALALDTMERTAVEVRLSRLLEEASDDDTAALLDDLVPVWRRAADTGQSLIGAQVVPG